MFRTSSRIRYSVWLYAYVLLCLGQNSLHGSDPILLRYKFQPDQRVRYSVQMRDDYVIQLGETEERPYTSQASIKSFRVLSVDEQGRAQLELVLLEQVRVEALQAGKVLKFDSSLQDQQVPELFLPMQAMVGQPHLKLTVSPTGEVTDVIPLNGAKAPESGNETAMDVLVRLPVEPVEIGGRWTEEFNVPVQVSKGLSKNVRMQRQFQLQSVENNVATIEIVVKSLTPLTVPEEEVQLLLRTPRIVVQLDLNQGLILSKSLVLDNRVAGLEKGKATVTARQLHVEKLVPVRQANASP